LALNTENPVTVQVVVVSKRFLVLMVIREILTLLTILCLEIERLFFTDKDIHSGLFSTKETFALTSIAAILKSKMCQLGFF